MADLSGGASGRVDGAVRARGGQDPAGRDRRGARGGGLLPVLRRPGASALRRAGEAPARSDRRGEHDPAWAAAASSCASVRGTFRWPSSPGQVAAALVAGNAVIAKPAEQTGLVAWRAVRLFPRGGACRPRCCTSCRATERELGGCADPRRADRRRRLHRHRPRPPGGSIGCWPSATARSMPLIAETGGAERDDRRFRRALPEQVGRRRRGKRVPEAPANVLRLPGALRPGRHRRQAPDHAGRGGGDVEGRRSGPAGDRCRPGDRRRRVRHAAGPRQPDGPRRPAADDRRSAARQRRRHVLRAARLRGSIRSTVCRERCSAPSCTWSGGGRAS